MTKALFTITIDRDQVRRFASAIGEQDPVFHELAAARAAGHPDLPLPPTMLFGIEGDTHLAAMGVEPKHVLHVEQSFTYHCPVHAGEELTFVSVLTEQHTRRRFLVQETTVTRAGQLTTELRQVLMTEQP
jgi:acyl dehydratase